MEDAEVINQDTDIKAEEDNAKPNGTGSHLGTPDKTAEQEPSIKKTKIWKKRYQQQKEQTQKLEEELKKLKCEINQMEKESEKQFAAMREERQHLEKQIKNLEKER